MICWWFLDPRGPPLGGTFREKEVIILDPSLFFFKIIFVWTLVVFFLDFGLLLGSFWGNFLRFVDWFPWIFATDALPFQCFGCPNIFAVLGGLGVDLGFRFGWFGKSCWVVWGWFVLGFFPWIIHWFPTGEKIAWMKRFMHESFHLCLGCHVEMIRPGGMREAIKSASSSGWLACETILLNSNLNPRVSFMLSPPFRWTPALRRAEPNFWKYFRGRSKLAPKSS